MPPGTERCQLGGGGSSQEDADCWRHRKPLLARYFGRALLQRIAVDHGLLAEVALGARVSGVAHDGALARIREKARHGGGHVARLGRGE